MDNYCSADSAELIPGGPVYFTTLEKLIDSANEVLHLQTYIWDSDETGMNVLEALKRAAQRGVKITVLLDGFGSASLSEKYIDELKNNGISFRFFSPMFASESVFLGRRLHHKIVVADKMTALIGGINISNKYHGVENKLPWLDYAVLVKGQVCSYLDRLCEDVFIKKKFRHVTSYTCPLNESEAKVRFRRNDWIRRRSEVYLSYLEALNDAKKEVIIVASYFHPDPSLKLKIKKACTRGVEVKILLAGLSDFPFSKNGEKHLYSSLLRCGVRIYEWPRSVLHGKAMIVDDEWVTIGSYNLNELSHYLCIELNTDVKSKKLNAAFRKDLEQYFLPENEVKKKEFLANENIFTRSFNFIVYWCFYGIMRFFLPGKRNL